MDRSRREDPLPVAFLTWTTAAVLLVVTSVACSRASTAGPLRAVDARGGGILPYSTSQLVHRHQVFTFADILVVNHSEGAIILENVELLEATGDVHIRDAAAGLVDMDPVDMVYGAPTFPPDNVSFPLRPLRGFRLAPQDELGSTKLQIFLGLEADRGNEGMFKGVAIYYQAEGSSHRLVVPIGLRTCAPPRDFRGATAAPCEAPELMEPPDTDAPS